MAEPVSNVFVFFGATGDLAYKQIFPALQAMTRRGHFDMPVIGVASSALSDDELIERAKKSVTEHGGIDAAAFKKMTANMHYLSGDYTKAETYDSLAKAIGPDARPLFYLAIPPDLFTTVIGHLAASPCAKNARFIIEKPFGRDLESAQKLNQSISELLPESSIFRIDHYLGKEPVQNLLYFRFANRFVEPLWSNTHIASIQITMAEQFGVPGRERFYESVGAVRDVVQNHLLQVLSLLAMEAPHNASETAQRAAKLALFRAMRPIDPREVVRGQFEGYRGSDGVAAESTVETFVALRMHLDTPRWSGVPIYIRAGKCLPLTATEVTVRLKEPETALFALGGSANEIRFRLSPDVSIALSARVKEPGEAMQGGNVDLIEHQGSTDEMSPYERLLGDAMHGDATLFASYEAIEAAWRVVDPVLSDNVVVPYSPGSWGPAASDALIAADGGWHNPTGQPDSPHA